MRRRVTANNGMVRFGDFLKRRVVRDTLRLTTREMSQTIRKENSKICLVRMPFLTAHTMSFHTSESLLFGDVTLSCVSSPESTRWLNINRVACSPLLPEGVEVDSVDGYVVELQSPQAIHNFSFDLVVPNCRGKGSVETGEHLDAQSWQLGDGLLMIGTEDSDAFRSRISWLAAAETLELVEFLPNGFRASLDYIPPGMRIGFHFVLAYNRVESQNDSEWFAVDIPHGKLRDSSVIEQVVVANAT